MTLKISLEGSPEEIAEFISSFGFGKSNGPDISIMSKLESNSGPVADLIPERISESLDFIPCADNLEKQILEKERVIHYPPPVYGPNQLMTIAEFLKYVGFKDWTYSGNMSWGHRVSSYCWYEDIKYEKHHVGVAGGYPFFALQKTFPY